MGTVISQRWGYLKIVTENVEHFLPHFSFVVNPTTHINRHISYIAFIQRTKTGLSRSFLGQGSEQIRKEEGKNALHFFYALMKTLVQIKTQQS